MSFDPFQNPGTWRSSTHDFQREVDEHAAQYAEVHPDRPVSIARRVTARLRGALGRSPTEKAPLQLDEVWAREEARYRAKNKGKPEA